MWHVQLKSLERRDAKQQAQLLRDPLIWFAEDAEDVNWCPMKIRQMCV